MWPVSRSGDSIFSFECNRATVVSVGVGKLGISHRSQEFVNSGQDVLVIWQLLISEHDSAGPSLVGFKVIYKTSANSRFNSTTSVLLSS